VMRWRRRAGICCVAGPQRGVKCQHSGTAASLALVDFDRRVLT
jgi:hypothetical protein